MLSTLGISQCPYNEPLAFFTVLLMPTFWWMMIPTCHFHGNVYNRENNKNMPTQSLNNPKQSRLGPLAPPFLSLMILDSKDEWALLLCPKNFILDE